MNRIEYLADHPTCVEEIAQLRRAHWQHTAPKRPYEVWLGDVEVSARKGELPMTLVTLQDSELRGFVTLVAFEEKAGIKNGVWLITLYVKAQYRGAGLGRSLVERCLAEARSLGCSVVHLWTESTHLTEYYARIGWRLLGQNNESGEYIMVYDLGESGSVEPEPGAVPGHFNDNLS
jgi:GNAT superfamily N-acetyltransferase